MESEEEMTDQEPVQCPFCLRKVKAWTNTYTWRPTQGIFLDMTCVDPEKTDGLLYTTVDYECGHVAEWWHSRDDSSKRYRLTGMTSDIATRMTPGGDLHSVLALIEAGHLKEVSTCCGLP